MQAPYDARALANYILDRADNLGFAISNMHINKIIYFAHGHFLSGKKMALVDQPFEAWEYGPVIQDLYHRFKRFGKDAITERAMILDKARGTYIVARCKLADEDVGFLNALIDFYIRIPASRLSDMSHEPGGPWDRVWNYEGKSNPGMFISDSLIVDWFSKREAGKGA
ncbi:MAG TPA: type II toxin-antitoxin system antitoxin SocA domain-containing protein [Rhizomicrobium sp.]|nr:type II toxin-antitoxin system antitoxin SocA domain-containing protein [Rhizomicrobium sp.]